MKNWTLALLVLAVIVLGFLVRRDLRDSDELHKKIAAYEDTITVLWERSHVVDTTFVHDTVVFTKFRTRYDTMLVGRDISDTMWVRNFIDVADSTVRACSEALDTCAHRVAVRDSIIQQMDSLVDVLGKAKKPGRFGCVVGGAVTPKGIGPGAACGLRL